MTRKAFESVYIDKGFTLVGGVQDLQAEPPAKAGTLRRSESGSVVTSSAAEMAKALQIDKTPPEIPLKTKTAAAANAVEDVTGDNAAAGVTEANEDDLDTNYAATEERKPAGRDRGRTR